MRLTPSLTRPLALSFAAFTFVAATTGCSHQAPAIDVGPPELAEREPTGLLVKVPLIAHNPNEVDLDLFDIHYTFAINGQTVFTGMRSAEAALVRRGTQRITLPIGIPRSLIDPAANAASMPYTITGEVAYQTPAPLSETLYEAGFNRPTASFKGEGVLDLTATPETTTTQTP